MVDTGLNANTGSRIARCRRHMDKGDFFVSYSDCLCNVDLSALVATHRNCGKTITVTGVQPSSRFGTFSIIDDAVSSYTMETKLTSVGGFLNGGYMVMSQSIFKHLELFSECNLEREVFSKLAAMRQVGIYPHSGYWQAIDTERDLQQVNQLYIDNKRPWLSLGKS